MTFSEHNLRLYAVTDSRWASRQTLFEQVEAALRGGATMVQLREKALGDGALLEQAREMARLCHRYGVPLIVNDRADIAQQSGADGVHVGQEDMQARDARALLGSGMIVGVTAKTVEQALLAQEAGADYLGSGAVFGSQTKQNALPMTRETLRAICQSVSIPVAAIGGITEGNLAALAGTGIAGVAVVSGIFAAEDIEAACRRLLALSDRIRNGGNAS